MPYWLHGVTYLGLLETYTRHHLEAIFLVYCDSMYLFLTLVVVLQMQNLLLLVEQIELQWVERVKDQASLTNVRVAVCKIRTKEGKLLRVRHHSGQICSLH